MRSSSAALDRFPFVRLSTESMKYFSNSATASSNRIPRSTISVTSDSSLLFISVLLYRFRYSTQLSPELLHCVITTIEPPPQLPRGQISDYSRSFKEGWAESRSLDGFGFQWKGRKRQIDHRRNQPTPEQPECRAKRVIYQS